MALPLRMGALPAVALGVAMAGYGGWILTESNRPASDAPFAAAPTASTVHEPSTPTVTVLRATGSLTEPGILPVVKQPAESLESHLGQVTPISFEEEAQPEPRYGRRYAQGESVPQATETAAATVAADDTQVSDAVPPQPGPLNREVTESSASAARPEGVTARFNHVTEQATVATAAVATAAVAESHETTAPVVTAAVADHSASTQNVVPVAAQAPQVEPVSPPTTQTATALPRNRQVATVAQAPVRQTSNYAPAPQYLASTTTAKSPETATPAPQSGCCNQPACSSGGACYEPVCKTDCLIDCCEPCGPYGRTWVEMDYLGWWLRDAYVPALVTTSPAGTPLNQAGVLGEPGASILFGNTDLGGNYQSGGRLRVGHWLDDCQTIGLQGEFFAIGDDNDGFSAGSDSFIIARPFYNTQTGQQDSQIITYPGVNEGMVEVRSSTQFLGAGAQMIHNLCCDSWCDPCATGCGGCFDPLFAQNYHRIDMLIGYRYLGLNDGLNIGESTTSIATGGQIPQGTTFGVFDEFHAENDFHGGEIGLKFSRGHGRWTLDVLTRVALGTNRQTVRIDGNTVVQVPGLDPIYAHQGLLAQPTNIGSYSRNRFAVVPEIGANLGYRLTENLQIHAGYTFIYWGNVVRAGEHIDTTINPSQLNGPLVGPARPAFSFVESGFWAQGINLGAELRF